MGKEGRDVPRRLNLPHHTLSHFFSGTLDLTNGTSYEPVVLRMRSLVDGAITEIVARCVMCGMY